MAYASYSGRRIQTILFKHRDRDWLLHNLESTRELLARVGEAPTRTAREGIDIVGPVESRHIADFVRQYNFHERSRDLDGDLIAEYIEGRVADTELTHFKIAIMSRHPALQSLGDVDLGLGKRTPCINRSQLKDSRGEYADIKALMSRWDRVVDLDVGDLELSKLSVQDLARMRNLPAHEAAETVRDCYSSTPFLAPANQSVKDESKRA